MWQCYRDAMASLLEGKEALSLLSTRFGKSLRVNVRKKQATFEFRGKP